MSAESPSATRPRIRLRDVWLTYATQSGPLTALERVTLDVREGEFLSVVGPSGCGKSTLLKIVGGLLDPTSGSIDIRGDSERTIEQQIGIVFQTPVLLPWATVMDNVLLPLRVFGLRRQDYAERARELLGMVGLDDMERKYPFELSGGMQQRVAIVRALVYEPDVLLLDEPFSALDAMTREQLNLDLRRIWRLTGKTILFITHSIQEAVFLGTRMLVMTPRPGRISLDEDVKLPDERSLDLLNAEELGRYVHLAREHLEGKAR